jgi:sporulation protein YlmC with PRC-barrel domain
MAFRKQARLLGAAAVLCGVPMVVMAQTPSTTPAPSTPPAAKPQPTPTPGPAAQPSTPSKTPATTPSDKSAAATKNPLIGLAVFSSDGSKLGTVHSVTESGGKVSSIHIKTGGFLGFGGKLVAIPEGKFTRTGDNVQLAMTSDEVNKLPEVKDNS